MSDLFDLRTLRQFVVVAETEHVSKAAERLHLSQSPLSRRILQLEDALGFALFERRKMRLHLTRDGEAFLAEARGLLAQAEAMERQARRRAQGETGILPIGYVEGAIHADLLPRALLRLKAERPEARTELRPLRSQPQIDALLRSEIDFGILYNPPAPDHDDLASRLVWQEPLSLVVAQTHPLAARDEIEPADLADQTWVGRPQGLNPAADRRFHEACAASGFVPDIAFEAPDPMTALGIVASGLAVALMQASMRTHAPASVRFFELPWFPMQIRMFAIWRRRSTSPLIARFGEIVCPPSASELRS